MRWLFRLLRNPFKKRKSGVDVRDGLNRQDVITFKEQAEHRLGKKWQGNYCRVSAEPGLYMSDDPPWKGMRSPDWKGVATGSWAPRCIVYYTTSGAVRPATGIHEWAHEILHTHHIGSEFHHDIMRRHGIR